MTLTFDLLTSNLVHIIARRMGNYLPTNFDISGTFCQTDHVTLRPWPLSLEVMALIVGDTGLRNLCTKLEVRRPLLSEDMTHFRSHH